VCSGEEGWVLLSTALVHFLHIFPVFFDSAEAAILLPNWNFVCMFILSARFGSLLKRTFIPQVQVLMHYDRVM
jgi:hypothetical protein